MKAVFLTILVYKDYLSTTLNLKNFTFTLIRGFAELSWTVSKENRCTHNTLLFLN